jgi:hypothetical protein
VKLEATEEVIAELKEELESKPAASAPVSAVSEE